MSFLVHTERCRDINHMSSEAFINLCQRIKGTMMVKDAYNLQLTKFLHIIGHNVKNQSVS